MTERDNLITKTGIFDFIPDISIPGFGDDDEIDPEEAAKIAVKAAKFLTVGPSGFILGSLINRVKNNVDIGQIGSNFINNVNNLVNENNTDINLTNFANSVKTNIADIVNPKNITERFSIANISNIVNTNLINNSNLLGTFANLIESADLGSLVGRFVDADNADNLIEMIPEDIQWQGGLRSFGGNDRVLGTDGRDIANGNQGDDTMIGSGGEDFLRGGQNEDLLEGGAANDILNGNRGNDTCRGGLGDDILRGGQDNDELYGDEGNDILIGDVGSNFLNGGEGADDFILRGDSTSENAASADRILDFNAAQGDRIKLTNLTDINQISLGSVDVNRDGISDTAILGSNNQVLGVVMNANASTFNLRDSISVVGTQDTTINIIG